MSRLPSPGGDDGVWGQILNEFLAIEHNSDGSLKATGSLGTKYTKPGSGIPKSDLSSAVQASLDNADAAVIGSVPDADASTKGKLQLTGDLTGTASSPSIATGAVTNAKISSSADIAQSKIHNLSSDLASKEPTVTSGTTSQYYRGDKSWQTLDKISVGLNNVDNTSDANKPLSNAAVSALSSKADSSAVLAKSANLSDLASASTARTNLGLGTASVLNAPSSGNASSSQVVLGSDTRLTGSGSSFTTDRHLTLTVPALNANDVWHSAAYDGLPAYFVTQAVSATITADHSGSLTFETSSDASNWTVTSTVATSSGTATVSGSGNVTYFRIGFTCGNTGLTSSATVNVTFTLSVPS